VGRSKKSRLLSSHPPIFDHALTLQVQFYRNARLLPTVARATELAMIVSTLPDYDLRMRKYARLAPPYETNESGNGQLGIFEGLTSDIDIRGTQPQSNGVRCDCITETSASFAVRSVITGNVSDRDVSMNLLNYAHLHAGFHQPWAVGSGKPDPYTTKHTRETRPWHPSLSSLWHADGQRADWQRAGWLIGGVLTLTSILLCDSVTVTVQQRRFIQSQSESEFSVASESESEFSVESESESMASAPSESDGALELKLVSLLRLRCDVRTSLQYSSEICCSAAASSWLTYMMYR
jgi:hypothetical protein